jgi:exodeoxyribonuclease-3
MPPRYARPHLHLRPAPLTLCRFNARANNKGWRLDHFLVSQALHGQLHECYHLPGVMGSDHCPLGLVVKL